MRWIVALVAIAVAGTLFAAAGGGGGPAADAGAATEAEVVSVRTFQFMPDRLVVEAGTTVEWANEDATVHTATAGTRRAPERAEFDGAMDEGESFRHTFDAPGTYRYFCDRHSGPGMTATVVVE
jgi:plastocyanin